MGLTRKIEVVAKRVNVVASSDGVGVGGFDSLYYLLLPVKSSTV